MPPMLLIPTKMERVLYELGRIYPDRERKRREREEIFIFERYQIVASIYNKKLYR